MTDHLISSLVDEFDSSRRSATGKEFADAPVDPLKRGFDIAVASTVLLVFLPLLLLIVGILATQGWPILIRHRRVGRFGRTFSCLKFRTMVCDADQVLTRHLAEHPAAQLEWEATRKLKDDPRVTPFGHALRKSSIDELPQLLNVLRGEMSLVGPRPIVADEIKHYGADIALYQHVRPGLTGAWQVSGRSDVSYANRVRLDCEYVRARSFTRDLVILALTVPAVLRAKGSY